MKDPYPYEGVKYAVDIPGNSTEDRSRYGLPNPSSLCGIKGDATFEVEGGSSGGLDGIQTPYLYISFGRGGAPFSLHREDANLCSLNHLHFGEKMWMMVASEHAEAIEDLAEVRARKCSQQLRHDPIFLESTLLSKARIPFSIVHQTPGDIIVTLPNTYHQGFSRAHTLAEAVNFAIPGWDPNDDYVHCSTKAKCPEDAVGLSKALSRLRYTEATTTKTAANTRKSRKPATLATEPSTEPTRAQTRQSLASILSLASFEAKVAAAHDLDHVSIVKFFTEMASGSALLSLADQLAAYGRGVDVGVEADEEGWMIPGESPPPAAEENLAILRRCAAAEASRAVDALTISFQLNGLACRRQAIMKTRGSKNLMLRDMIGREAESSLDGSERVSLGDLLRRASFISLVVRHFGSPAVLALFPPHPPR